MPQDNNIAAGSFEKEETGAGNSVIHKNAVADSKEEVVHVNSPEKKEEREIAESVICEEEVAEGGPSEENEKNDDEEQSLIRKMDSGETSDLDTSHDLVIDESVGVVDNNRKSVTFDLEEKCADVSSGGMSVEGMEDILQDNLPDEKDKKECDNINENIDSSDTIPADDIEMPQDEFDSEDDIPLMQNVHRPQYIKSEKQEDEDKESIFSDSNTEPDGKWGKLKVGDKLKR